MLGVLLIVLAVIWVVLLFITFREPAPKLSQLLSFLGLLAVTGILSYLFMVKIMEVNPNPTRVRIAQTLTEDKLINLATVVPGVPDALDNVHRIDTDGDEDEDIKEEWLVFYQYDVRGNPDKDTYTGPFGAAIYDYDDCRPPALLSYELVPVSYDYLGELAATVAVENIIAYPDPLSANEDRPEVIINGISPGAVKDLNIFRKVGIELNCLERQQWQAAHSGEAFPNPHHYENVGSFRANERIERAGHTVTVVDRAGFERSQLVVRRQYRPMDGSYFRPGTQVLLDPVEYSLAFKSGQPDQVTQVYYPEKAVLAFYSNLGKDAKKLDEAKSYLSPGGQMAYDISLDPFGLSTDPDSVAMARDKLARVLVWEIRYEPDVEAEQLHKDRQVRVTVVGVSEEGTIDYEHPCQVTWVVIGEPRSGALPYNCEWRLDRYQSTCMSAGEKGEMPDNGQWLGRVSP